jgi:hypothetical protein
VTEILSASAKSERTGKLPSVYLDTTIPSYLTARPTRDRDTMHMQRVSCLWWNAYRTHFDIHVSWLVLDEASSGDKEAANRRTEVLLPLRSISVTNEALDLAQQILVETRMPEKVRPDAEHVAVAATNGIDVFLTWNSRHLANPHVTPKVRRACERAGFGCPEICKPDYIIRRYIYGRDI